MGRKPNIAIDGEMSPREIHDALSRIVFTAAHGWQRSVSIDETVRNYLTELLRSTFITQTPDITVQCRCGWGGKQSDLCMDCCPSCMAEFEKVPR